MISDLNKRFMFHEVINVIEEEGAEVVNANFSIVGDKIYHTIHSQVNQNFVYSSLFTRFSFDWMVQNLKLRPTVCLKTYNLCFLI